MIASESREVTTDELRAVEGGSGFGFGTATLVTATSNLRVSENASTPMKSNSDTQNTLAAALKA